MDLELDKDSVSFLSPGTSEEFMLTATVKSDEIMNYEIKLTAASASPASSTDNNMYINFVGKQASGVKKTVVFAEDMIVGNPECLELKEMLTEADTFFETGKYEEAIEKSQEAVEACREIIKGPKRASYPNVYALREGKNQMLIYVIIATVGVLVLGMLMGLMRRIAFRKRKKYIRS